MIGRRRPIPAEAVGRKQHLHSMRRHTERRDDPVEFRYPPRGDVEQEKRPALLFPGDDRVEAGKVGSARVAPRSMRPSATEMP